MPVIAPSSDPLGSLTLLASSVQPAHNAENERNFGEQAPQDEGAVLDVDDGSDYEEESVHEDDFSQEQDEQSDEDEEDESPSERNRRPKKKPFDLRNKCNQKRRLQEDPDGVNHSYRRRTKKTGNESNESKSSPDSRRSAHRGSANLGSGRSSKQSKPGHGRTPSTHRMARKQDNNYVVLTSLGKVKVQSFARVVASVEGAMYENYLHGIRTQYPSDTYRSGLGRGDERAARYVFTNKEKLDMLAEHRKLFMAAFDVMKEVWSRDDPNAFAPKTTQFRALSRTTAGSNGNDYSIQQRLSKLLCMAQEVGHNILNYKIAPLCEFANGQKNADNQHLFQPKPQKWGNESLRFHGYAPQLHGTGDKHHVQMLTRVFCDHEGYIDESRIFQHCRALCDTEDESRGAQNRMMERMRNRQPDMHQTFLMMNNDQSRATMPMNVQVVQPILPVVQPSVANNSSVLPAAYTSASVTVTPVVALSTSMDPMPTSTPFSSSSFSCDTTVSMLHSDVKHVNACEDPLQENIDNPLKRKNDDMLVHEQFADDCMVIDQISKFPKMEQLKTVNVKMEEQDDTMSTLDILMKNAVQPWVLSSLSESISADTTQPMISHTIAASTPTAPTASVAIDSTITAPMTIVSALDKGEFFM
jgi:hypothetical protein